MRNLCRAVDLIGAFLAAAVLEVCSSVCLAMFFTRTLGLYQAQVDVADL